MMSTSRACTDRRRLLRSLLAGACASIAAPGLVLAHGREQHAAEREAPRLTVKPVSLGAVPNVPILSMQGRASTLSREFESAAPLIVNFIFTTCSTTCSMQTAVLAELQRQYVKRGAPLSLVSITIDPDNDTPDQMQRFAKSFQIEPGWQFLTGKFDDLVSVQSHFDVYRGSKISHPPVVMLRRSPRSGWLRIEGYPTPKDLAALVDGGSAPA